MATAPAATDQLTVTADSRLSDDYLLVSPAQVDGDPRWSVCLAGSQDGTRLCHFAILDGVASELQPSDQSPTGTMAVPLPGGGCEAGCSCGRGAPATCGSPAQLESSQESTRSTATVTSTRSS